MRQLVRYAAGYILDFLRERVAADDFRREDVRRVLLGPGLDDRALAAVRRLFPNAELRSFGSRTGLCRMRRLRFDAACIPMAGGSIRTRAVGLLSGARHKLLIPSPDYIYRFGMRTGWMRLLWALVDRFLLTGPALVWLGAMGIWLYVTGAVDRAAEPDGGAGDPFRRAIRQLRKSAERRRLRRAYRRPPTRGPRYVQIGISEVCNYRCLMCPFHSPYVDEARRAAEKHRLPFEQYAALLRDLRRMATEAIDICGSGEPLTHPDAMEMIALARRMGFEVRLATNGALLAEGDARRLVDLGVERIHLSFNAATEETYLLMHPGSGTGTRQRIIECLRGMADYAASTGQRPVIVEFSAVLTRLNMHEITQMVEVAHETRATQFMLILMGPPPSTYAPEAHELPPRREDWPSIRQELARAQRRAVQLGIATNLDELELTATEKGTRSVYERVPCYIGHEFALILGNGGVLFCCQCPESLGNLNDGTFDSIWNSGPYQEVRRQALALPVAKRPPASCKCFLNCSHVATNLSVHKALHGEIGG